VTDPKSEFVQMLMLHQQTVHKICRAYCPLSEDQRDLFQEITLQLWRAYPNFKGESKENTWIYRIALNVAISHIRRKKARTMTLTEAFQQVPEPPESFEKQEQIDQLYQAIYTLSDLEKALVLLYFEDKSMDEIAGLTGISVGNVRVKMHRIREKLRVHIQSLSTS
jgi:RNA polymerase sigma-70 factor, ECF subfamily